MRKLFALSLTLMMVFSLAACGSGDDEKASSSNDKTPSRTQQQEQGDKTPAKYIMTFKKNENPNPSPETNWTVQYKVFEFGEKYLSSAYYVYEFGSVEDAEAFMTHRKETMGPRNKMELNGTTVFVHDDSYNGASLSTVKDMFDESEYTLKEN